MSRRALAPLVLALLVVPAAGPAAAKTPKVTPKTGTYKGSEQNTKKPAVLTVTKSHGALRVSANLTVHVECQDKNGVKSEKDIPLNVAGKLHTAGYYSPQFKQRVNGYAFSQKKRTTGYPTGPDSFQNVLIQFTSSTRGSVDAVYNDSLTGPDSPDVLSRCDSHSLFWKPAWQKPKRLAAAALPSVKPKTGKYTGSDLESHKPGILKISHPKGGGYRISSLSLTVHVDCEDGQGVQSERDVPVALSGKLHKAVVNSRKNNKFVNSYKFSQIKQGGGGPNVPRTFQNVQVEILSPTRAAVTATYNERTTDADNKIVSDCNGGTRSWTLNRRK